MDPANCCVSLKLVAQIKHAMGDHSGAAATLDR